MIFDKIIIGGSMKKVYILLLTLLIVGCESKSINSYKDIDNYYRIYTPYKDRSSVYSISTINSINMEEVETELMDISKIYYDYLYILNIASNVKGSGKSTEQQKINQVKI